MKKILLIIAVMLILFSCKSTPGTTGDLPEEDLTEIDTIAEVIEEMEEEIEDIDVEIVDNIDEEPQLAEESPIEEEVQLGEASDTLVIEELPVEDTELAQIPQPVPPSPSAPPPVPPPPIPPTPTPQPPPELPLETEQLPPQEPELQQVPQRTPPSLPPIRETPPVPTPMQSIIVPREPESSSEIIYSRVVRATVGQIIEIPFRGTGWVYLGELASRRGVAYDSRRNDPDGQSFIFRAEEAGTYALKFSRHDFIRDYILNDHVQIIIGEAPIASTGWFGPPVDRGRVVAQPRWPSASEEAEILRGGTRPNAVSSAQQPSETPPSGTPPAREPAGTTQLSESAQSTPPARELVPMEPSNISEVIRGGPPGLPVYEPPSSPPSAPVAPPIAVLDSGQSAAPSSGEGQEPSMEVIPAEQLIQRAREAFDAGNVAAAIALLDQYSARFPSGTDELYWLYGQFYEANSPSRNILLSLDYYRRLTTEFPQSNRFNDARRRIAYLERFYINIQ